jgi:hypothetical protein
MRGGGFLIAAACLSAPAFADQKDVAAQFFEAGSAAAKRKDYRVCAEAFAEAHRRAAHGAAVYNAALCWQSAKELPLAANGYAEALERSDDLSPGEKAQARARLDELAQRLGQLELTGPSGGLVSVGPLENATLPAKTYLVPGAHTVKAQNAQGAVKTLEVEIAAGEKRALALEFPAPREPEPKRATAPKAEPAPAAARSDAGTPWQVPAGWAGIGVGVVTAGIGGAFYLAAVDAKEEFDSDRSDQEKHDLAESRLQTARILGIAGGVLAAVGVTLLLTAGGEDEQAAARIRVELGPASAHARVSF